MTAKELRQYFGRYEHLGTHVISESGTELIGKAPHIGNCAWLFEIFSPITDNEISEMEAKLECAIPHTYRMFLCHCSNGLRLFVDTLNLFGHRGNYNRDIVSAYQPYDIITLNNRERPTDATEDMFFIGSYDWDGSLVYISRTDEKVHFCKSHSARPLYEWESFDVFLQSEIIRLDKLFDDNGIELDTSSPTIPIFRKGGKR